MLPIQIYYDMNKMFMHLSIVSTTPLRAGHPGKFGIFNLFVKFPTCNSYLHPGKTKHIVAYIIQYTWGTLRPFIYGTVHIFHLGIFMATTNSFHGCLLHMVV